MYLRDYPIEILTKTKVVMVMKWKGLLKGMRNIYFDMWMYFTFYFTDHKIRKRNRLASFDRLHFLDPWQALVHPNLCSFLCSDHSQSWVNYWKRSKMFQTTEKVNLNVISNQVSMNICKYNKETILIFFRDLHSQVNKMLLP